MKLLKNIFNKNTFFIIIIYIIIFIPIFSTYSLAAYPKLVSTLNSAFQKIESWLVSLSTPAAAVAVAVGVFMKKFSFGDDERMRTGKRLIRTALISYALILVIDLVLSTIQNLLIEKWFYINKKIIITLLLLLYGGKKINARNSSIYYANYYNNN